MNDSVRTGLKVSFNSNHENLGGRHDDRWSADSYCGYHVLNSVTIAESNQADCVIAGEVKAGDRIFLLWFIYSTGDSFHNHRGYDAEAVAAYTTYEAAKQASDLLQQHDKNVYTTEVPLGDGTTFSFHPPWYGYFESLDGMWIEEVIISGKKTQVY